MSSSNRRRRARVLAASFVVTVAPPAMTGCKKQPVVDPDQDEPASRFASIHRGADGHCLLITPQPRCPKGVACNPPAPIVVDCPPEMRDAGDPPAITRRPAGKEGWVRVPPQLYPVSNTACMLTGESFCAPPGKPHTCTEPPARISIPCSKGVDDDGGASGSGRPIYLLHVPAFVYKDGLGACRRAPATECLWDRRCDVPDGEVVPCP